MVMDVGPRELLPLRSLGGADGGSEGRLEAVGGPSEEGLVAAAGFRSPGGRVPELAVCVRRADVFRRASSITALDTCTDQPHKQKAVRPTVTATVHLVRGHVLTLLVCAAGPLLDWPCCCA